MLKEHASVAGKPHPPHTPPRLSFCSRARLPVVYPFSFLRVDFSDYSFHPYFGCGCTSPLTCSQRHVSMPACNEPCTRPLCGFCFFGPKQTSMERAVIFPSRSVCSLRFPLRSHCVSSRSRCGSGKTLCLSPALEKTPPVLCVYISVDADHTYLLLEWCERAV